MTLVVDASALADFVLSAERGKAVARAFSDETLIAPELLIPETMSAIRRWLLKGCITEVRAAAAIDDMRDTGIKLISTEPLVPRAWELRHGISTYDSMYVALADLASSPLVTSDKRLASAAEGVVEVVCP